MSQEYSKALEAPFKSSIKNQMIDYVKKMPGLDKANAIADIAGIFDPTPISDGVGTALSLARGDWLGAGLSIISFIPYAGDALAKPAKMARYGEKLGSMAGAYFKHADKLASAPKIVAKFLDASQIIAARKQALAKVRAAMLKARKTPNCAKCKEFAGKLKMPNKGGKWKPAGANDPQSPNFGNGEFKFDTPKKLPDGSTVDSIKYKDGFPDFDNYVKGGKHDIMGVTGDVGKDITLLKNQHGITTPGKDYTLHHFDNGQVGYLPRSIHNVANGGAAHAGGNTMLNSKLF